MKPKKMKKNLATIILATSLLSGCVTSRPVNYSEANNPPKEIYREEKSKDRKGFLDYAHDILTGWVPFYGVIRYEFFEKDKE